MRAFDLGLGLFLLSCSTACGAASALDVDLDVDLDPDAGHAAVPDSGSDVTPPPVIDPPLAVDAGLDACAAQCAPGARRCEGDAVETCTLQSNGCAAWTSAPCGPNRSCTALGGAPVCTCAAPAECASAGSTCEADGTHVTCATNSEGCSYVSKRTTCALGCEAGASCVQATAIGAGYMHACALASDGTMRCWGYGMYGQVGSGSPAKDAFDPVPVQGLSGATALGLGGYHSCALVANGGAKCWGRNDHGQLGDGTQTDRATAVSVVGLSDAFAIAGGLSHTCALQTNGTIRCWGSNSAGQLGDGTTEDSVLPVTVVGVQTAVALSTGEYHSCALLFGGEVTCWGQNAHGQLGNGTTQDSPFAANVPGLSDVAALSSSSSASHVCAILRNGDIACWGDNESAQIGDGNAVDALRPLTIAGLHDVAAVAAGGDLTCSLGAIGVDCWGTGNFTLPSTATPGRVFGLADATALAAGWSFACALRGAGDEIDCWGGNLKGQLGNGTRAPSNVPLPVR